MELQCTMTPLLTSLMIDFKALQQGDGLAAQSIFEGNREADINLARGIEGVKHFELRLITINPLYFLVALAIFYSRLYLPGAKQIIAHELFVAFIFVQRDSEFVFVVGVLQDRMVCDAPGAR